MKVIAVIPARGGSKRFPGKNIYPLAGKPLVAYPIEAAKKSKIISRVIVSTDDEEIARVAREYGAETPFMRPQELAGDESPVVETMRFMMSELEKTEGYRADYAVLLQATTPLVLPEQLDEALGIAQEKNADSVVSLARVDSVNHPFNIREMQADGTVRFWQHELHYGGLGKKRPPFFRAANFWITKRDTLMREGRLEGARNFPYIVPSLYGEDIDYREDLERVEALVAYMKKKSV